MADRRADGRPRCTSSRRRVCPAPMGASIWISGSHQNAARREQGPVPAGRPMRRPRTATSLPVAQGGRAMPSSNTLGGFSRALTTKFAGNNCMSTIFLLTGWVDWARCAAFDQRSSHELSSFSRPPRRPGSLGAPVRRHDGSAIRDGAALGCGAERPPTGVSALGAADAGNDGPDGITVPAERRDASAASQI